MERKKKVLFIGLDAADKDLILAWAREGLLPTFRSLLETAAWSPTVNPPGLAIGGVWVSFASGLSPAQHGRYFFRQIQPGTYEIRRFRAHDLDYEPFWSVLGRAGRRVAVFDVPKTRPIAHLNGIQVTDWGTHEYDGGFETWPPDLGGEILRRFGPDPVGTCDVRRNSIEDVRRFTEGLRQRIRQRTEMYRFFLSNEQWDFFLASFSESHCAGHHLWHLHDPTHPRHDARQAEALGDPLRDVYQELDRAVAALLEAASEGTQTFVLASHGMGPHYDATHLLDDLLARMERREAPRIRPIGAPPLLLSLWQKTPPSVRSLLRPLRNRIVRRIDEAPLRLDATRRWFHQPIGDSFAGIRLNLAGREPEGTVQPGADFDRTKETLCDELRRLVNADTGNPVVRSILSTADLYDGPYLDRLPDLIVEWVATEPIRAVESPSIGRVEGTPTSFRTGDHRADGLVFVDGCDSAGRRGSPVSVTDLAATIGALLDVPMKDHAGTPVREWLCEPPHPERGKLATRPSGL